MHVAAISAHTRLVRSAVVRSRPRSIAVAAATPDTDPPSAVWTIHNGVKAKMVRRAGTAKPAGFFGRQVAWAHALAPGSIAFASTTIHVGEGEFTIDDLNEAGSPEDPAGIIGLQSKELDDAAKLRKDASGVMTTALLAWVATAVAEISQAAGPFGRVNSVLGITIILEIYPGFQAAEAWHAAKEVSRQIRAASLRELEA